MKNFIQQFKEEHANIEYCCYCTEPKDDKISCCSENHFVPFSDLDDDTQMDIINDEYDTYFGMKA